MKLVNGELVKETAKDKADIEKRKKVFEAKKKAQIGLPIPVPDYIELLVDKGLFTRQEYLQKIEEIRQKRRGNLA